MYIYVVHSMLLICLKYMWYICGSGLGRQFCYVAVFQEENSATNINNNGSSSKPKLPHKPGLAASKAMFTVTSPTGLAQNSNNSCSGLSIQPSHTVITSQSKISATKTSRGLPLIHMSPHSPHQPLAFVSPSAVTRDNAAVGRLPSPLLPCPRSPDSTVNSCVSSPLSHRQQPQQRQPFVAATVLTGTRAKQLPVYVNCFMPQSHPQPFYRPGFTPKPVGMVYGGAFHNNLNSSQQTPAVMFQPNISPQVCILSAPSAVIHPGSPACQNSSSRTDVPLNPATSIAVTSAVQPGLVVNGASPLALPNRSGMVVNDDDFSILEDAIKDEQAALSVNQNMPANHAPSCSQSYIVSHSVETSSAESDSSLSDWSIIELPSQPTMSSVAAGSQDEASLSLMQFSLDGEHTDASDFIPHPGGFDQFQTQKLPAAGVSQPGSDCVSVHFVYFDNGSGVFDCLLHSRQTLVHCSHLMCL